LVRSLIIFCSSSTAKNLRPCRGDLYGRPQDERIVFGVARLEPRSNSASAHVKPGGIEAPQTIPSFSGYTKYPRIRGIGRLRFLAKNSNARFTKFLRIGGRYPLLSSSPEYPHLYSSPLEGEDKRRGALEGEEKRWGVRKSRPYFLAKIPNALYKLSFNY